MVTKQFRDLADGGGVERHRNFNTYAPNQNGRGRCRADRWMSRRFHAMSDAVTRSTFIGIWTRRFHRRLSRAIPPVPALTSATSQLYRSAYGKLFCGRFAFLEGAAPSAPRRHGGDGAPPSTAALYLSEPSASARSRRTSNRPPARIFLATNRIVTRPSGDAVSALAGSS